MNNEIFDIVNYPQIKVSTCLNHLEDRIVSKYGLKKFDRACDKGINTIFFGIYTFSDVHLISKHKADIAIMYGGSDIEVLKNHPKMLNKFNTIKINHHIAISKNIQNRLEEMGIHSVLFDLNLVNNTLFKPVTKTGTKVFIYNGLSEGHEETYGKIYYDQVVNALPNLEFVYSNKLGLSYEQMPDVYKDCFIGLRLTNNDGNANMVQEMVKMGIPVVHNGEQGGIKWKSVDDVIKIINKYNGPIPTNKPTTVNTKDNKNNKLIKERNTIVINCDTHIDIIDGCTMWLTNTINKYIRENKKVVLINSYEVHNVDNFMRNIVDLAMLEIVNVRSGEVIANVKKYTQLDNVANVIIRNKNILYQLCDVSYALQKLIIYGLDIHVNEIKNLNNNFYEIWTQSDKLKQLFLDSGVEDKKIKVMPPIATKYEFVNNDKPCDNILRFIYAGTIRDEECVLEIIEEFSKVYLNDKNILLTVAYGKIIGNIEFMTKVNKIISEGVDGVTFMYNLSHLDTCKQIFMSDIGLCCRKNEWGANGEISTKITEYETYGLQICDNIAKMRSVVRQSIMDKNEYDIVMHTNVDLDVTNGDNIWLSTLINTLHLDNKRVLYLPIGTPKTDNTIRNIIKTNLLTILPCKNIGDVYQKLNEMCSSRTKQIILRHDRIIKCILDDCKWINLVDFYCYTNNCKEMSKFNGKCNSVNVYDEELRRVFIEYGVNAILQKHVVWDYKFDLAERDDDEIRLIYVGTIRENENFLEMIEEFKKMHSTQKNVLLKIIYGNIVGSNEFVTIVNNIVVSGMDGITFICNVAHKECCKQLFSSDIGICTNNKSIKYFEYEMYKLNIFENFQKLEICKKITELNVACILDNFSHSSFCDEFNLFQLHPSNWKNVFNQNHIDLFMCESAWSGISGEWKGRIYATNAWKHENRKELLEILDYCKLNKIKTMFWNKEDPAHYDDRKHDHVKTSMLFDNIFTSSSKCVKQYFNDYDRKVNVMGFGFQEKIFNPIGCMNNFEHSTILFAGSYYKYFPKRCEDFDNVYNYVNNNNLKLKIHDRFFQTDDKNHMWPEKFIKYLNNCVSLEELNLLYKKHKLNLTINSVTNCNTMFARRIFEICASGGYVFSNESIGIKNIFGDNVTYINKSSSPFNLSNNEIRKKIQNNINIVFKNHINSVILQKALFKIGIFVNSKYCCGSYTNIVINEEKDYVIHNLNNKIIFLKSIKEIILPETDYIILSNYPVSKKYTDLFIHCEYSDKILCVTDKVENHYEIIQTDINLNDNIYICKKSHINQLENSVISAYCIPTITNCSIIVPCYNSQLKLNNNINSIKKMICDHTDNIEIFYINDASTDETVKMLTETFREHDNVTCVSLLKNSGSPSKPRNVGMSFVKSLYVSYLDADDEFITKAFTKKLIDEIIINDFDCVKFPLMKKNNDTQIVNKLNCDFSKMSYDDIISEIIKKQSTTVDGIYKVRTIKNIIWNNTIKIGEDTLYFLEVYKNSKKIKYFDFPIYIYNSFVQDKNNLSTTQMYTTKCLSDHTYVLNESNNINDKYISLRGNIAIKSIIESLIFKSKYISEDTFVNFCDMFSRLFAKFEFNFINRYMEIIKSIKEHNYEQFVQLIKIRVVISGFDFKFIENMIPYIDNNKYLIRFDKWQGHIEKKFSQKNDSDTELKELIKWADVVHCEWMLGNAVWYSNKIQKYQKLIIRCHRFELTRNDHQNINFSNVYKLIAVSPYYVKLCEEITQCPHDKIIYVPNFVECDKFIKSNVITYNVAIVGILPVKKNLHRAIEILNIVNKKMMSRELKINLNVYGKTYNECSWLVNDKDTINYFNMCDVLTNDGKLNIKYMGHINLFEKLHENDFVLSVSEKEKIFESFHIAPAEGFCAGCISLFMNWNGVEDLYPEEYIFDSYEKIADYIVNFYEQNNDRNKHSENGFKHVKNEYDIKVVSSMFESLFFG